MADPNKIFKKLEKEFEHVKTYITGRVEEPVWFACNMGDPQFRVVSIYLDSEIGGFFTLDEGAHMQYVYEHFDAAQAEALRDFIINKVENGDAIMMGDMSKEVLH